MMDNPAPLSIAARNKKNYLAAKQAFNENRIDDCAGFYAPDHQIKSRPAEKGRQEIRKFFETLHATWPGLRIDVEHALAEDDWVMGHSRTTATHSKAVLGVAPTNRRIEKVFWDLHRFDAAGLIVESWNLTDSLAIMQQLGLVKGP
ncbi:MAG: ester cyclase [Reyranella sp.]|nr:ester cyclase [Reyranella sp.]